jgi:hypothetical protein
MMGAVSDDGRRGRGMSHSTKGHVTDRRVIGHHPARYRGARGQQPGEALIVGGFSSLGHGRGGPSAYRAARRREAARVAAPLAVPVALGVTLGVILAVSSGPTRAHITPQRSSGSTSARSVTSSSAPAVPGPSATGG